MEGAVACGAQQNMPSPVCITRAVTLNRAPRRIKQRLFFYPLGRSWPGFSSSLCVCRGAMTGEGTAGKTQNEIIQSDWLQMSAAAEAATINSSKFFSFQPAPPPRPHRALIHPTTPPTPHQPRGAVKLTKSTPRCHLTDSPLAAHAEPSKPA